MERSSALSPEVLRKLIATQQKAKADSIAANALSPAPVQFGTPPGSPTASSLQEPDETETSNANILVPNEESLFLPDDTPVPITRSSPTKRCHSDVETLLDHSMNGSDIEEVASPPRKQAKIGKAGSKSKSRKQASKKSKAAAKLINPFKKAKPPKKEKKLTRMEQNARNIANFNGLYSNNVFRDIATNLGRDEAPRFQATRKQEALKQLLASIPEDCRPLARYDKKQLDEAAKALKGKCATDPITQGWKMTGMTSSLTHYQMLGVSYMRTREEQMVEPRGGLLADSMGLGSKQLPHSCTSILMASTHMDCRNCHGDRYHY